jgi:hypothetical protein
MRWQTNPIDLDESNIIGLFVPASGPVDSDDDSEQRRRQPRCPCCPHASSTRFSTAQSLFEHMQEMHFPSTPAPTTSSSSSTSSTVNFETQKGRKEAIKQAFRKANADEKSELLLVSLQVPQQTCGFKRLEGVCV